MASRYDVLVVDLDGTLLSPDGTVSPGNVRALDRARGAGVEVIVATGRALVESRATLEAIGHDGMVITAGGSMLCDAATGRTLERSAMPHELVHDVTTVLIGHGHKALLLKDADEAGYDYLAVGPAELDPASHWWFETMPVRVRFVQEPAEDPHPAVTTRVGVVASAGELEPLATWLTDELGDRAFLQHWPAVTATHSIGSTTHLLEVFNPEVNKWTMVGTWCRSHGVSRERVAAIGDGLNDVDLVREAGLGIAMGNAIDEVRVVADRETTDWKSDGVAVAVDHLLDGRW